MSVTGTQFAQLRKSLSSREWGRLTAMAAVIIAMNVLGWGIFIFAIMPHHFNYQGLGSGPRGRVDRVDARSQARLRRRPHLRHRQRHPQAHGRRQTADGHRLLLRTGPLLDHRRGGRRHRRRDESGLRRHGRPDSTYETVGGVIGTALAATFPYLIALLNLVVLAGIIKVFRDMRRGRYDEAELERQFQSRGLMYRFFGRVMRSITQTWQMFLVGVVFGIGFDTATEVLLLAATAAAATQGLPWYAVMALPLLFAGGMTLFDTIDGCFMNVAYGWAFSKPVRKVYYNLVITGLSIAAAFVIGTIEMCLLSTELHLSGGFWNFMANFDINKAGFVIVGLFIVVWVLAVAVWRFGKVEQRWSSDRIAEEQT